MRHNRYASTITMNDPQSRDKALLETIRRGLFLSSVHKTKAILGDRSRYIDLSEISNNTEKRSRIWATVLMWRLL